MNTSIAGINISSADIPQELHQAIIDEAWRVGILHCERPNGKTFYSGVGIVRVQGVKYQVKGILNRVNKIRIRKCQVQDEAEGDI